MFNPTKCSVSMCNLSGTQRQRSFFARLPIHHGISTIVIYSFSVSPSRIDHLGSIGIPLVNVGAPSAVKLSNTIYVSSGLNVRATFRRLVSLNRHGVTCICNTPSSADRLHFDTRGQLRNLVSTTTTRPSIALRRVHYSNRRSAANTTLTRLAAVSPAPATIYFRASRVTVPILCQLPRCKLHIPHSLSMVNFSSVPFDIGVNLAALQRHPGSLNTVTTHGTLTTVRKPLSRPQFRAITPRLVLHSAATVTT